jgi:SAM-dependent methyltransferase
MRYSTSRKVRGKNILMAKSRSIREVLPETYQAQGLQRLWRAHSDLVNQALIARWRPVTQTETLLKTDLFDEAVSDGLSPLLNSLAKRVFYIDSALEVHEMAKGRYSDLQTIGADVRHLPFANGTFDGIVSNSTLDHFESLDDLSVSLQELFRVLRPGGQMILTLDNLSNPIILLRNCLPFPLLKRLKIVPYYVGVTLRANRLEYLLKETGFEVLEVDAIMHCPRILAVALAHWMERFISPRMQRHFLRFLMAFETLSCLPTRFLTGYFVAIKATKR